MKPINRRRFLQLINTGAASLSLLPVINLFAEQAPVAGKLPDLGPLTPRIPTNTDDLSNALIGDLRGRALLSLPAGFTYSVISATGDLLSDGQSRVPSHHDGMAAFSGDGDNIILVRNHELDRDGLGNTRCARDDHPAFDPFQAGGTTTLTLDSAGQLMRHEVSLAGTARNCAGGLTPWGSWLSCEETFSEGRSGLRHGYVFEVPCQGLATHQPLTAMGRFNHEAAAVDPNTGVVYLTEDRGDGLLYRFTPSRKGDLQAGGVLDALQFADFLSGIDTSQTLGSQMFRPFPVRWVRIDEPDPDHDNGRRSTRAQGRAKGAARFSRGEGAWWGNDRLYFSCTSGGRARRGQVFSFDPKAQTLTLVIEATNEHTMAAPDNLTVGPQGRVYICEDGSGVERIWGLTGEGRLFEVARNVLNGSETAGICFSPAQDLMFVNIQDPGLTCVIRGPWASV